jgi:hypothetical protein
MDSARVGSARVGTAAPAVQARVHRGPRQARSWRDGVDQLGTCLRSQQLWTRDRRSVALRTVIP